MKTSSAKAKARRLQNEVAELLKEELGLTDDDVKPALMGERGEDVILLSERARFVFPFSTECKNQERISIWDALKQAEAHVADERYPLVVFKRNRSKTYATLEIRVLVKLCKALQEALRVRE